MKYNLAVLLATLVEDAGGPGDVYEDYSGKFMNGKRTTGVVVDSHAQLTEAILIGAKENYLNTSRLNNFSLEDFKFSTDSLGLSFIYY